MMTQATHLSNRGILKITGKDRGAFLQGLITNDVNKITSDQAIYAALLSPQGKFQYDFFVAVANVHGEDAWLVECERDHIDVLLKRLSLYKLRSDVRIENISDNFWVYTLWGSDALSVLGLPARVGAAKGSDREIVFVDPRLVDLGVRIFLTQDKVGDLFESWGCKLTSFEDYDLHRLKLGVPDGNRDVLVDRGILLECGFDELNAIDWNKGCYMGQELTARTRYRGLVRKRLIPVRVQGMVPTFRSPILQGGVEVGDIRTVVQEWGIAMIRLEALSKSLPFSCENATVTPHIPYWMCLPSLTDQE